MLAREANRLSFCGVEFCGLGQDTLAGLVEEAVDAHSLQPAAAVGEEELLKNKPKHLQVDKKHAKPCDRDDSVATPPASPATFWAVPTMRPPALRI